MQIYFHTEDANIIEAVNGFVSDWNSASTTFEVSTSGSTGKPKRILIQKKFAEASARTTCEYLGLKIGQQALLCLSPDTIAGKMMIVRSIVSGMDLHIVAPSAQPFEDLSNSIDFTAFVPYQMSSVLERAPQRLVKGMKIIVGGGPVSSLLESQLTEIDASIFHTFGMTETISHIALRNLSKNEPYFKTVPGVHVASEEDQLVLSAPHLGIKRLKTNDCIELVDKQTFKWIGRSDFVINSGGVKIHPEEVEKKLEKLFDVSFFVSGIPDPLLGEKLILCVENSEFLPTKANFSEHLSPYLIPKKIYIFKEFKRTSSGKVNRSATLTENTFDEKPIL